MSGGTGRQLVLGLRVWEDGGTAGPRITCLGGRGDIWSQDYVSGRTGGQLVLGLRVWEDRGTAGPRTTCLGGRGDIWS